MSLFGDTRRQREVNKVAGQTFGQMALFAVAFPFLGFYFYFFSVGWTDQPWWQMVTLLGCGVVFVICAWALLSGRDRA
jgi:hypothetical protein